MSRLVLCHWDCDGIASAVLFSKATGGGYTWFTPQIGNYFLDRQDRQLLEKMAPEEVVVLDMSLPEQDLRFLSRLAGQLRVFDHHHGRRAEGIYIFNPVLDGADPESFPSTTSVLKAYFDLDEDFLYYAGIFGDVGFKLSQDHPLIQKMNSFLQRKGMDWEEFVRRVRIIDAQYKTGDRDRVYSMIDFLISRGFEAVGKSEFFSSAVDEVEREKERELKRFVRFNNFNLLITASPFKIVSDLCRAKFTEDPESFTVVVGRQGEMLNFYMRTRKLDLGPLVVSLKGKGFFAGGKKDVVGVVVEPGRLDSLLQEMENYLKERGECFSVKEKLRESSLSLV